MWKEVGFLVGYLAGNSVTVLMGAVIAVLAMALTAKRPMTTWAKVGGASFVVLVGGGLAAVLANGGWHGLFGAILFLLLGAILAIVGELVLRARRTESGRWISGSPREGSSRSAEQDQGPEPR